jgi:hypothetical protein
VRPYASFQVRITPSERPTGSHASDAAEVLWPLRRLVSYAVVRVAMIGAGGVELMSFVDIPVWRYAVKLAVTAVTPWTRTPLVNVLTAMPLPM